MLALSVVQELWGLTCVSGVRLHPHSRSKLPDGGTFLCEVRGLEHVPRQVGLGFRGEK